ncbi:hypothetical protein VDGD_04943 [Verticillium dahliae]|nr:hypothetical protein VDGD_04943 [Verticillium dahliae]
MDPTLPAPDYVTEKQFWWPWNKFCLPPDALYTTLHERFNTRSSTIQEPSAFHRDVVECANNSSTVEEFYNKLAGRKSERINEIDAAWTDYARNERHLQKMERDEARKVLDTYCPLGQRGRQRQAKSPPPPPDRVGSNGDPNVQPETPASPPLMTSTTQFNPDNRQAGLPQTHPSGLLRRRRRSRTPAGRGVGAEGRHYRPRSFTAPPDLMRTHSEGSSSASSSNASRRRSSVAYQQATSASPSAPDVRPAKRKGASGSELGSGNESLRHGAKRQQLLPGLAGTGYRVEEARALQGEPTSEGESLERVFGRQTPSSGSPA